MYIEAFAVSKLVGAIVMFRSDKLRTSPSISNTARKCNWSHARRMVLDRQHTEVDLEKYPDGKS